MRITCLLGAALLFLATACGSRDPLPEPDPEARLRSIKVSSTSLVLPEGGSAQLSFSVKDPAFAFAELLLQTAGGEAPAEFHLKSFSRAAEEGDYTAVLEDAGLGKSYDRQVCLAIRLRNADTGAEWFVRSPFFGVSSAFRGPDTGLPVVYVDTEKGQPVVSKEDYVDAVFRIAGRGGYEDLEDVVCGIRGRGNTTWTWPKKPYLIKLDQKESVLGMPKHKRWVLLANFMDRTLMRNLVSMKVASLTSLDWTPRCVPVELVLNGQHQGSYLLIEQVRVDKNRVPVTEMTPEDNAGEALTGGYLLELDFHYDNEIQWTDPNGRNNQWGNGVPFGIKSPDSEDITPQQVAYIKGYVSEAANTLYGPGFDDPENGYAKYLDVASFIDYWLVFEVMCNHELGNPGSVYMHKDRGGKLTAGPCWDFDWGVLSFRTSPGEYDLVNGQAIWYERLFQDPAFREKARTRFRELLPQLETIPAYMDECEALLTESAALNFRMWNPADDRSQNGGNIINGDENLSFHDAVERLKANYLKHLQVIAERL